LEENIIKEYMLSFIMNLLKKLGKKNIMLLTKKLNYKAKVKTGYVSITKPITEIKENIVYVDAITTTKHVPPVLENCIFVSSPDALTELRLAIKSLFIEKNCEIVVIDDVSSMKEYNDLGDLTSFLNAVILMTRENNKKLILIVKKESNELINDLTMFSDVII
jgi:hypothetical protein